MVDIPVKKPGKLTQRAGIALSVLGVILMLAGAWWPSHEPDVTTIDGSARVVMIDPSRGRAASAAPAFGEVWFTLPPDAVAGVLPQAEARAFAGVGPWASTKNSAIVTAQTDQPQTDQPTTAQAADLWRGEGPVGAGDTLRWMPKRDHVVLLVRGPASAGDVAVHTSPGTGRGLGWLRFLGELTLVAGVLLLLGRLLVRLLTGRRPGSAPPGPGSRPDVDQDAGARDTWKPTSTSAGTSTSTVGGRRPAPSPEPEQVETPERPGDEAKTPEQVIPYRRRPGGNPVSSDDANPSGTWGRSRSEQMRFALRRPIGMDTASPARRRLVAAPLSLALVAGVLAGCSGGDSSQSSASVPSGSTTGSASSPVSGSASGSASGAGSSSTQVAAGYPAVDQPQALRVIGAVDAAMAEVSDADSLAANQRVLGPQQQVISARIKAKVEEPTPAALRAQWLGVPVAGQWPRWFAAAGSVKGASTPGLRILRSPAPRAPYGLWADMRMLPGATLPPVDSASGAAVLAPDEAGLAMTPAQVADRYANVLNRGTASSFRSAFVEDEFRQQVTYRLRDDRKRIVAPAVAQLTSRHSASQTNPPLAIRTRDGGALVIVTLEHLYQVDIPAGRGGVKVDDQLAALAGRRVFSKQLQRRSLELLAFAVPPKGQVKLIAAQKADISATGS